MAKRAPVAEVQRDDAAMKIRTAVARIPRGRVSTYGSIARVAGLPGRARLVGTVLKNSPDAARLPWFRVINSSGRSSFPQGSAPFLEQRKRLTAEGVSWVRGRIDLKRYGWPAEDSLDEALWGMQEGDRGQGAVGRMKR